MRGGEDAQGLHAPPLTQMGRHAPVYRTIQNFVLSNSKVSAPKNQRDCPTMHDDPCILQRSASRICRVGAQGYNLQDFMPIWLFLLGNIPWVPVYRVQYIPHGQPYAYANRYLPPPVSVLW